jgi:hypothetical protein
VDSYVEDLASLAVGSVEAVAPDEIHVSLEFDAPQATALNAGQPSRFPRINGYVLIPNEGGALVGLVAWLGVERSAYPKRPGLSDFGLVDLPFPQRKMLVNPIATLRARGTRDDPSYELERGVAVFPSVGDQVLLPTATQLRAIVESEGSNRRVRIGTSPLAANANVSVDPDKIFGRHLAVLGNTGSGKSCSVAGLIRWSIEAANKQREILGAAGQANARFIILDPNGEYTDTFRDLGSTVRVFQASVGAVPVEGALPLTVPAWMWNSHEWTAFTQASSGVQRPLLVRGLRDMRAGARAVDDPALGVARDLRGYRIWLDNILAGGPAYYGDSYAGRMNTGGFLRTLPTDLIANVARAPAVGDQLSRLAKAASDLAETHERKNAQGRIFYEPFTTEALSDLRTNLGTLLSALPEPGPAHVASEDSPSAFSVNELPDYLELLTKGEDFAQGAQHIPTLLTRLRTLLGDPRLSPIINPPVAPALAEWLTLNIGSDGAVDGQIAVIDLSLVPSDVLHVAVAVIARLVFEACQRYRKLAGKELPTTLVLEEAHTFVRKAAAPEIGEPAAALVCRETFERIAREGRKFGMGLVLSSQRPSELSPTVLAQCNTFLLHRIVNDRDQELVARLVPDTLGGLLRDLPSLPSRQAVLLGWATPVPVLVEMSELPPAHRPRSEDPRFWDVWTGREERPIDWNEVAEDWTRTT